MASVTYTFTNGTVANALHVNQNFTDLVDEFGSHDHDGSNSTKIATLGVATDNSTKTVTISNLGPAALTTATIAKWCKIDVGGVDYYIPLWL